MANPIHLSHSEELSRLRETCAETKRLVGGTKVLVAETRKLIDDEALWSRFGCYGLGRGAGPEFKMIRKV